MHLHTIKVEHFRNIAKVELQFAPGINILLGDNGQGKTNLLEAIFALALLRPFRSREKEVFMAHGAEYSRVRGEIVLGKKEKEMLEIFWEGNGSKNGTVFRRNKVDKTALEFLKSRHFYAVLFAPEDMDLPFAAPRYRRQFLSRSLAPLFPEYLSASLQYEKVLKHRNKLLLDFPNGRVQKMEFAFWDAELCKWSEVLWQYRRQFFLFVAERLQEKYALMAKTDDQLSIQYLPANGNSDGDFFGVLEESFPQDVRYGSTQKGPHRDDFELLLNDKPLSEAASRGEVRSAILALKLCERDFVAAQTSLFPVLILDDVFSELDESRRTALMDIFRDDQVFLSTTHLPKIKNFSGKVFAVQRGEIKMK